jgi:hypothetical protein
MPEYAGHEALALEPVVREWHQAALPFVRTKSWAETWKDFRVAWGRVLHPGGCGTLAGIAIGAGEEHDALRRLEIVAADLQRRAGDKPFPLSCRVAAKLAGISPIHANRLINRLLASGDLVRTRAGQRGSGPGKLAAEYRFNPTVSEGVMP